MTDTTPIEPPQGRVTIHEVARRAGVSIATVSHTINRPHRVSAATRERVMQIIDELQFVPKATAISQARKGVGRIGVLAPFTAYGSYWKRLAGVLGEFRSDALDVAVFDHGSVADMDSPLLDSLPVSGRLDGLVVMGIPLDDGMAERLLRRGLPTVLVDSAHPKFSSINVDDEAGGRAVARHLIERGHRTFAFVSESQRSVDYVSAGQKRVRGFLAALAEAGGSEADLKWVVSGSDVQAGRDAADDVLALDPRPTAVFALHDELAAGVFGRLRGLGVEVPGEIAVVGYDGSELAEALDLTTVVQPLEETGRLAAALLRAALGDPGQPVQHINLQAELVVGSTT